MSDQSLAKTIDYINSVLSQAKNNGASRIILISGEIHKALGYNNAMPTVCNAMYKCMRDSDRVLKTTPSGYSSTITIEYYL